MRTPRPSGSALGALFAAAILAGCGGSDEVDAGRPPAPPPSTAAVPAADSTGAAPTSADSASRAGVMREVFAYSAGGRDPFQSLLAKDAIGPDINDLLLVGVYSDVSDPAASVAVLRDKGSGRRYRVRAGDRLSERLTVARVGLRDVVFRIDEFGTERTATLSLRNRGEDLQ
ncbi:MAG: hypothetical protein ACOY71_11390 [Gemmatimonadota bacterium]